MRGAPPKRRKAFSWSYGLSSPVTLVLAKTRNPSRVTFSAHDSSPRFERLSRLIKYLSSHLRPVKSLQIQLADKLKRLASAVRFRPWPPFFSNLQTGIRVRHAKLSFIILG